MVNKCVELILCTYRRTTSNKIIRANLNEMIERTLGGCTVHLCIAKWASTPRFAMLTCFFVRMHSPSTSLSYKRTWCLYSEFDHILILFLDRAVNYICRWINNQVFPKVFQVLLYVFFSCYISLFYWFPKLSLFLYSNKNRWGLMYCKARKNGNRIRVTWYK